MEIEDKVDPVKIANTFGVYKVEVVEKFDFPQDFHTDELSDEDYASLIVEKIYLEIQERLKKLLKDRKQNIQTLIDKKKDILNKIKKNKEIIADQILTGSTFVKGQVLTIKKTMKKTKPKFLFELIFTLFINTIKSSLTIFQVCFNCIIFYVSIDYFKVLFISNTFIVIVF